MRFNFIARNLSHMHNTEQLFHLPTKYYDFCMVYWSNAILLATDESILFVQTPNHPNAGDVI